MAGINSRFVRSPPAPKITKVQGGAWCAGVCVSRRFVLSTTRTSMVQSSAVLPQGFFDGAGEPVETTGQVAGDVRAQRAPAALGQHVEIATRLRLLDNPEGIGLAGHREVLAVVASDLQENAAIGAALISLPRRVLEARAEADAGRRLGAVADHAAQLLHCLDMRGCAIDIGEQRRVVSCADASEMRLQRRREVRRLRL